jgi:hypothetical protein
MTGEVCMACGSPIEPGEWIQLEFALDGPKRGPYHQRCLKALFEETSKRHLREAEEARKQRIRDKNLAAFRERRKAPYDD